MKTSSARWLAACALAVLAAGQIHLRVRRSLELPRYQAEDESGYFRSESAAQYRYARMAAAGRALPDPDTLAQYPEGIRTGRELTTAMERAAGASRRLLGRLGGSDFRRFVLVWSAAVSSLCVFALGALAWLLCGSAPLALAAAAAFAWSWAGISNGIGTCGLESFALPMLAGGLAFLAAALRGPRSWPHALAAGLLTAAALASWHFARFHLAALWLALGYAGWRRSERRRELRDAAALLLACCAAAGLLSPVLRHNAFIFSPIMNLGLGVTAALTWPGRLRLVIPATIACVALSLRLSGETGSFGHVYALLWDKLRFGLARPADPSLLSAESRLLWTGPFASPQPGFLLYCFLPLGLLILPRLVLRREKDENASAAGALVDGLFVLYLAGTAMVTRLTPMLAWLLCAAGVRLPRRWITAWTAAAFLFLAGLEAAKCWSPASPFNPVLALSALWKTQAPTSSFAHEKALLSWLRTNAGPDRPVLAGYGLSASLLTYAGTPTILQPKFEAPGIRAKVLEYLAALYSNEDAFYAFCRRYRAAWFVYSTEHILDESPDGPRYASGSPDLTPETPAVLFHFAPERLQGFKLAYENPGFRVFTVLERPRMPAGKTPATIDPVYDIENFKPMVDGTGRLHLAVAEANARRARGQRLLFLARILYRTGRREEALSAYKAALAAWPLGEETKAARPPR
ncbi:MAG: hypothetical protein PHF00_07085 [Elusimicrobia bacterium]|nr:hypothetical protein [Elusimicrobiota bacterium]